MNTIRYHHHYHYHHYHHHHHHYHHHRVEDTLHSPDPDGPMTAVTRWGLMVAQIFRNRKEPRLNSRRERFMKP